MNAQTGAKPKLYTNGDKSLRAKIDPASPEVVSLHVESGTAGMFKQLSNGGAVIQRGWSVAEMRALARWILAATETRRGR